MRHFIARRQYIAHYVIGFGSREKFLRKGILSIIRVIDLVL